MARPRTFDAEAVLDASIECFWRHGLQATSIRDLSNATGLNPPSLYNAFNDKRGLFVEALARYAQRSMQARIESLEAMESPLGAIRAFFDGLISRSLADPDRRGCLIVNSALEVAPHDTALGVVIAGYLAEIEAFFLRCLQRAQSNPGLPATLDPADTARMLLGLVLGLRVAARTRPERELLQGMVRPALALLEAGIQSPANQRS